MQVNGHFLPLEYSCCNFCITAKIHYLHPLSGCGTALLRNTAKPLFFLLPFLFQCLTHTEKALKDFCPLLKRATVPGAWYIHNNDYCQICMYHSFSPFWFSLHFYVSSQKPNLRHIGKKAHHLASITRVIIFAVRPFALFGRVRGKPAAFSSHNRVYTVPCSVFLCPVMYRAVFCVLFSFVISFCSDFWCKGNNYFPNVQAF